MPAPEVVYPPVLLVAKAGRRILDLHIDIAGVEHVPRRGGAVLACNHVSYLDFIFSGWGVLPAGRVVRFMARHDVFEHRVAGPLMRNMRHIPVDRSAGASSYPRSLDALRSGEIVGVFPEATISMSFLLKEFKTGAARLAADAGVPLLPQIVWGTQRLWTKGRPRTWRRHTPIRIATGEPLHPTPDDDPLVVTKELAARMGQLLADAQATYPDAPAGPDDTWWLPAALGGSAPTPERARELEIEMRQAREARRAQTAAGKAQHKRPHRRRDARF